MRRKEKRVVSTVPCDRSFIRLKVMLLVFAFCLALAGCTGGPSAGTGKQQASGITAGAAQYQTVSAVSESTNQQNTPAAGDSVKVVPAAVTWKWNERAGL